MRQTERERERERERTGCLLHLILLPSLTRQVTRKEQSERASCLRYASASSRFSSKLHSNTHITTMKQNHNVVWKNQRQL
jgi:hypothetical protein